MHNMVRQSRWSLGGRRSTSRAFLPWVSMVVLVAGIIAVLASSRAWSAEPEVVARVNGEPVTQGELRQLLADYFIRRQLQRELGLREPDLKELQGLALRKLITQRLILQEASRRKLEVTQQEVERAVAVIRRRLRNPKKFEAWLNVRGLDEKSLRDAVRTEILLTRVRETVVAGVVVSEQQVQAYYAGHQDDLKTPEEVRLRIFTLKDKASADGTLAALKKGEDLEHLAWDRSLESRAVQGGDMGWVEPQTLPLPLREVVGTLKGGESGGPVRTDEGFLVIRLEERHPARAMSQAEARPAIEQRLLLAKRKETFQAWLSERERMSKIEVFLHTGSLTTGVVHAPNLRTNAGERELHLPD